MQTRKNLWGAIPLLAVTLLGGCSSTGQAPMQARITDEVAVEAAIVSVDRATRELTLERPDGTRVVVVAGPEVRNFDQIEAGNKVSARYVVSLTARRLAADEPDTQPSLGVTAARAEPGAAPAGELRADVAMTVVVTSVDLERHVVVFTDPQGVVHSVEAERDEGRRFIAGLEPGDRVELVYGEALVLAVE